MNHFKSINISNNPLLVMGCTVIAFGVTHFYFVQNDSPSVTKVIGNILLFPVSLFEKTANWIGFINLTGNPVVIFLILLFTYSCIALTGNKIIKWRKTSNE